MFFVLVEVGDIFVDVVEMLLKFINVVVVGGCVVVSCVFRI